MPKSRVAIAAFCLFCLAGGEARAQTAPAAPATAPAATTAPADPAPSPALAAALATAQLYDPTAHPKVHGNNAYLTLTTGPNRTQAVYVSANLYGPPGALTRLVMSYVARFPGPIDPALTLRLLKENYSTLPYGYWSLNAQPDGSLFLAYVVELNVDAPANAVQAAMSTVAKRADALEAELTHADVY